MIELNRDELIIRLIKEAVESKGCQLTEVDLENLTIKVDGSDDTVSDCARAVADIVN